MLQQAHGRAKRVSRRAIIVGMSDQHRCVLDQLLHRRPGMPLTFLGRRLSFRPARSSVAPTKYTSSLSCATCAFSKHYPAENYVIGALSDSPDLMVRWVLRWLSGVRTRLRQRRDLLLEFIVLHHQLAVLQRTGTRRPCFRPSERLFWALLSHWWANWQCGLIIVQPATALRW